MLPERTLDIDVDVIKPIIEGRNRGKKHYLVIVAEGVEGKAIEIAKEITDKTGIEARATILGHIQRGGSPTVHDRVMASMMGAKAVETLRDGNSNRIIAFKDNQVVDLDIEEALKMQKTLPEELIELSKMLSL